MDMLPKSKTVSSKSKIIKKSKKRFKPKRPKTKPIQIVEEGVKHYAYIMVIPNPHGSLGSQYLEGKHRRYKFWVKIGDSGQPSNRLANYKFEADGRTIIKVTDGEDNPGKSLEIACLGKYPVGSLREGGYTEWHFLSVATQKDAMDLGKNLWELLNRLSGPPTTYETILGWCEAALTGTAILTVPEGQVMLEPVKFRRISLVVMPGIQSDLSVQGFAQDGYYDSSEEESEDKPNTLEAHDVHPDYSFQIQIRESYTQYADHDAFMASAYTDCCPDITSKSVVLNPDLTVKQREAVIHKLVALLDKVPGVNLSYDDRDPGDLVSYGSDTDDIILDDKVTETFFKEGYYEIAISNGGSRDSVKPFAKYVEGFVKTVERLKAEVLLDQTLT